MELQSLRLRLTDDDLNALAARFLPRDAPVVNVRLSIVEESVVLAGDYPMPLFNIPFQTTWEPSVRDGRVRVRLAGIRIVGVPVGLLRGLFLGGFRQVAQQVPGATLEDDTLVLDLDRILAAHGLPVKTNLRSIRCTPSQMIIEG